MKILLQILSKNMKYGAVPWMVGGVFLAGCSITGISQPQGILLNDIHSRLNATRVERIESPRSTEDLVSIIMRARKENKSVSISGGKHAMGGQQFGAGTIHISMTEMNDFISLDKEHGIVRVEAGITWPKLMTELLEAQKGGTKQWGIVQKQTGADHLSLGGALSANAHGRGVKFKPMIQDVEAFTLVNADGKVLRVSREENSELFQLTIGGYGLFGVIATIDLRLRPRQKMQRVVEIVQMADLREKVRQRLADGFLYGDYQYKTDDSAEDFMRVGVFSAYQPVADETPIPENQKQLTPEEWYKLLHLAHIDKSRAFEVYAGHYLKTNGQIYWSDALQMGYYADQYVEYLKEHIPDYPDGSLMITEVYVPRDRVELFVEEVISDVREYAMNVIYGTMRLIERDDESFLAWAKQNYACIIFNLRVEHSEAGMAKARADFQRLIARALEHNGSYFLTYHRWATKEQVLTAYPQFVEFLKLKLKYDPAERFQSEWYRHYKEMFAQELGLKRN